MIVRVPGAFLDHSRTPKPTKIQSKIVKKPVWGPSLGLFDSVNAFASRSGVSKNLQYKNFDREDSNGRYRWNPGYAKRGLRYGEAHAKSGGTNEQKREVHNLQLDQFQIMHGNSLQLQ